MQKQAGHIFFEQMREFVENNFQPYDNKVISNYFTDTGSVFLLWKYLYDYFRKNWKTPKAFIGYVSLFSIIYSLFVISFHDVILIVFLSIIKNISYFFIFFFY